MGAGIVEIAGKLAGNIFKRDSSGQHTQTFPRIVKRGPSAGQRLQRNSWRSCNSYWLETLTNNNRTLWNNYAMLHPITNKQGRLITLNAYQSFLSINIVRVAAGTAILASPPF